MRIRPVFASFLLMAGIGLLAYQSTNDVTAQESKSEKKSPGSVETDKQPPKAALTETKPPKQMDPKAIAKLIDDDINAQLFQAKLPVSPRSSDAEFIRRVSLDITGVIPTSERVIGFLGDNDPNKRAKLVDELLASPKYGLHLADIWGNLMYHVDSDNRFVNKEPLIKYLAESFNANKPWDRMVHEILTADGDQEKKGEVTYFLANRGVDKITDSVGKLFLGVQIQCAQCHNHPFTHWKQTEYWGMAQFFYKVNAQVARNAKTEVKPVVEEVSRPQRKLNPLPDSAKNVSAKFLGGGSPRLSGTKPYRPVLADWVCTPENPFFGKAIVNRVWAQYFGRGFVNPIDDLADENEPTHPALLKGLARSSLRAVST